MLTIRPVAPGDLDALAALHGRGSADDAVRRLVDESLQAFAGHGAMPQRLVFVLVDDQRLLGTASLAGSTGADMPRFSFRRGVVVHASSELKLFNRVGTLLLGNDHTGCAELTVPLMASNDSSQAPERLLIDALLLFVALHPDRFAATLICALPGLRSASGQSAFWNGLGRHFHAGACPADDALLDAAERSHIGRLLPKHPLYVSLISAEAQACIGRRSHAVRVTADALQAQGFRDHGHISIFDGGPVVQIDVADVRRPLGCVAQLPARGAAGGGAPWLVAVAAAETGAFKALLVQAELEAGALVLAPSTAREMSLAAGSRLVCLPQGKPQPRD